MTSSKDVKAVMSEFFGTFFIVFVSCWTFTAMTYKQINWLGLALANGLTVAACAWAAIGSSGAHFNPVVTLIRATTKNISAPMSATYILVQLFASVLASLFVILITPFEFQQDEGSIIGYPKANPLMSDFQIFIVEFLGSCLYVFAYYAFVVDKRAPKNVFGYALGATVMISTVAFGAFSGACVNPVRIFGPQVVTGKFARGWSYWMADIFGGVFAGFYYEFFLKTDSLAEENEDDEDSNKNMKNTENINHAMSMRY
jgi:glycerol uptake facilitator-like aquaporin